MKVLQVKASSVFCLLVILLAMAMAVPAQDDVEKIPQRADIEDKYKWKVEDMYPDLDAWEADFEVLKGSVDAFDAYKGHLGDSPETLLKCLKLSDSLDIIDGNLYVYAYLKLDEDNRNSVYQDLAGRIGALDAQLSEATSFIEPELLTLDSTKLAGFLAAEPELGEYRFYLEDQLRRKEHILSPEEETILALAGPLAQSPSNIFNMIDNADHKMGVVEDAEGKKVELTSGRYYKILRGTDRDLRRAANDTVQASWKKYINTIAATLNGSLQRDLFFAKARGYNSCLEASLDNDNIDTTVFYNLIQAVDDNIATLHKWTNLKKKVLGYDTLYTYDLSVPMAPEFEKEYTYEQAEDMLLNGLKPLKKDYLKDLKNGLNSGWVDVYETEGKGSGAYSWGTYTSHPYILMNFDGTIDNVFALAHEMGHALNSFYSNQTEPYIYHNHSLFTAEVASTCNEAILMKYLLKNTTDRGEKIALLNHYINQIEGTFFVQVMFSEFELAIHQQVENGGAISVDFLRQTYRDIFQKFNGPELVIGPDNDMGGMKISHFYREYYVYQYATSYAAAQTLSQKILDGDKNALNAYLKFLHTGSSMYPVDMLKEAGVDMTGPEPIERTIKLFGELVDEMEKLLEES